MIITEGGESRAQSRRPSKRGIQVTGLQHAVVNEAQVKVTANLQYQIENTGLKTFRVYLPTKLHRRVIGQYLLQATYHTLIAEQATEVTLQGVQAADVNLQRGFVTVQSFGRVQVRCASTSRMAGHSPGPAAGLQDRLGHPRLSRRRTIVPTPAETRAARGGTAATGACDDGVMLTQVRLEMLAGDKRSAVSKGVSG